jgi:hypothetical protein
MAAQPWPVLDLPLRLEAAVALSLVEPVATGVLFAASRKKAARVRRECGAVWRLFEGAVSDLGVPPFCELTNAPRFVVRGAVARHGRLLVVRRMARFLIDVISPDGDVIALSESFRSEAELLLELTEEDAQKEAKTHVPGEDETAVS